MGDDQILQRYRSTDDTEVQERSFGQLVEKYASMVLSVALRRVGDRGLAEEVTQNVFAQLARKADQLDARASIAGWLHRATMLESSAALRSEYRRKRKMEEFSEFETARREEGHPAWEEVLPKLDEALHRLADGERDIILQHYFEEKTHSEIAADTGRTEAACAKQTSRVLQKLSALLRKDGVVISAAALGAGLTANFAKAAPEGFAQSVTQAALSIANSSSAATAAAATTTPTIVQIMATTKLTAAVLVAVGAAVPLTIQFANQADGATSLGDKPPNAVSDRDAGAPPKAAALTLTEPSSGDGERNPQDIDLAALARELAKFPLPASDIGRELELQVLILQLPRHQVPAVLKILESSANHYALRRITRALFARWAEFDPEAATREGIALGNGNLGFHARRGALATWAASDPDAAFSFVVENYSEEHDIADMFAYAVKEMGRRDPEATMDRAAAIEDELLRKKAAKSVLSSWAGEDIESALTWAQNVEDDGLRTSYTNQVINTLTESFPDRALDLALALDHHPSRESGALNSIREWAFKDPDAAAAAYVALPDDVRTENLTKNASLFIVQNSPDRALSIAQQLPPGYHRNTFEYMAAWEMAAQTPADAAVIAEGLQKGWQRKNVLRRIAHSWLAADREQALEWIDRTGALGGEELQKALAETADQGAK